MNYFQAFMGRVLGAQKREQEKRDSETKAYNRAMAENAEYIAGLEKLDTPHPHKKTWDEMYGRNSNAKNGE